MKKNYCFYAKFGFKDIFGKYLSVIFTQYLILLLCNQFPGTFPETFPVLAFLS